MNARIVGIGAFVTFAVIAGAVRAFLGPAPTLTADPRPSSTNTQPPGARALYLWLEEMGWETRSWRESLGGLTASEVEAFALLEPTQELTPGDADALFAWVESGGTLLLAPGVDVELERRLEPLVVLDDDPTSPSAVRSDRVVPDEGERWRYRRAESTEGGAYVYPIREVAVRGPARVRDDTGEHSILFARDGLGVAAEVFLGEGVVLLFPEVSPLTNRGLAKADNVAFVASLMEAWIDPGTEIWFDEYDHGLRVAGSPGAFLARRRPGLFALAFLGAAWLAVLRFGRTLVSRDESGLGRRRDPGEFVEALGGLYARARAVGPAWTALASTAERVEAGRGSVAARAAGRERREALAAARNVDSPDENALKKLATELAAACRDPSEDRIERKGDA